MSGSDARVAVVATAHTARVFFCGGPSSYSKMTHWILAAPIDSSTGSLVQQRDAAGWAVVGQVDDAAASGTVTVASGSAFSFHADPVATGTIAGLYEAAGPCGKVGLIVAQGSSVDTPVGQGACVPASGGASPEQVNPIVPITRGADGKIPVVVDGLQLRVQPTQAPAD